MSFSFFARSSQLMAHSFYLVQVCDATKMPSILPLGSKKNLPFIKNQQVFANDCEIRVVKYLAAAFEL